MMLTDAGSEEHVHIILETLLQLFTNFQCHIRSISGTGEIDRVGLIIFNISGHPKIV